MIRHVNDAGEDVCRPAFRLSAIMSVYAAEDTVLEAIASVYPYVDDLTIAWGRDECFDWKADGTLDLLRALPDPDHKVRLIERQVWPGRRQQSRNAMRRACCERLVASHLLILDADEIWAGLDTYRAALETGAVAGGTPLTVTFWHGPEHWIHGGSFNRWGTRFPWPYSGAVSPLSRLFPWSASHRWSGIHVMPRDASGAEVWPTAWNGIRHAAASVLGNRCTLYHLGHALPRAKMAEKAQFYEAYDGRRGRTRWAEWDGSCGPTGDGVVEAVSWPLPPLVARAFDKIGAGQPA